jgi:DnaK suppressor protein
VAGHRWASFIFVTEFAISIKTGELDVDQRQIAGLRQIMSVPIQGIKAMNPNLQAACQQQLLAQQANLVEQITRQRGGSLDRANAVARAPQPEDDQAQSTTERELAYALDEHESSELAAVRAALQRIQDGSYGLCHDCGELIAQARLQATPEAQRCIQCQQAHEKA